MTGVSQEIVVKRVEEYSDETAAAIGRLMPFLSPNATGQAIPETTLRRIIESPDREQLVAHMEGRLVGSAVLNTLVGNISTKAWLDDFVADPAVKGQGVGYKIWLEIIDWCKERGFDYMEFTSSSSRIGAHEFYARQGAVARDTTAFRMYIPK
jgi:GNAT superfamily N-acetyltransferase